MRGLMMAAAATAAAFGFDIGAVSREADELWPTLHGTRRQREKRAKYRATDPYFGIKSRGRTGAGERMRQMEAARLSRKPRTLRRKVGFTFLPSRSTI
jgi:hypothetical protein